jgi:S-formylglutathione hydrolase FrmB
MGMKGLTREPKAQTMLGEIRSLRLVEAAFLTVLGFAAYAPAAAQDVIRCHTIPLDPSSYHGDSARVRVDAVGEVPMLVLVPADYDESTRCYPVVYLLQGGINRFDCFLGETDLIAFTASQPVNRQAIVVMPDVLSGPAWAGVGGRPSAEAFFTETLIPYVDSHYRTLAGRASRAIAGFSAGGLGALNLAGRRPDLFAAVASLSAVAEVNELDPFVEGLALGASVLLSVEFGAPVDPFGEFGNPATAPMGWHSVNPVDMAVNYGGVAIHLFVGDGTPCDAQDLEPDPILTFWPLLLWTVEGSLRQEAQHLADALQSAGVPHVFDAYGCGVHGYRYVERDIHTWWDPMFAAFGSALPASFDYRSADPAFALWGWTFEVDRNRAAEFLDVANASRTGVGLTGSGVTTVTTASYFAPAEVVGLSGAVEPSAVADAAGRITLTVDLGPPHQDQQYTAMQRLAEAAGGGYFTTRTVGFEEE